MNGSIPQGLEQELRGRIRILEYKIEDLERERNELRAACAAMREMLEQIRDFRPENPIEEGGLVFNTCDYYAIDDALESNHGRAFFAKHKRMKSMLRDIRAELQWRQERNNDESCQTDHTLIEWIDAALQDTEPKGDET